MAEEQGIDEAYLEAAVWVRHDFNFLPKGLAALRALALAVLAAEHNIQATDRCNCMTWAEGDRCRDYKALRARIEALGR